MTDVEKLFLAALYALYLYESTFWLALGDRAWTRTRTGWTLHELTPNSFTLLKRMPALSDLLLLRPGLIRTTSPKAETKALAKLSDQLDALFLLTMLCRMQAVVLLAYVPALLLLHKLTHFWPIALGLVVTLHLGIVTMTALAIWPTQSRRTLLGSILVNPMGAIRVLDPIAQALWNSQKS